MVVLWALLVVIAILLAAVILAAVLARAIGAVTDLIQDWRHRHPDFRQQGRDE